MKKQIFCIIVGAIFIPLSVFASTVIPDAELARITGQSGIVVDAILYHLIDKNYTQLTEKEQSRVRDVINDAFGPLTDDEVDQIIKTQLMLAEKIQQLSEQERQQIEDARKIIAEQLLTSSPAELLEMTGGGEVTAEGLDTWAQEKVSKVLIAQQILNTMIESLSPAEHGQMMMVQEIVNGHLDTLKK